MHSKPRTSAPLTPGSQHTVTFTDLLGTGQAVGRIGAMVVFVWGPLPEEQARVRITAVKKTYAQGDVVDMLRASQLRAKPFCPVFGVCGGCQVQHLQYPAQLSWKQQIVRNALARIGGFESPQVAAPVGMINPRAYRNKMSLVVRRRDGHATFGFYRARSHEFVEIERCPIVLPQLDATIAAFRAAAADPVTASAFIDVEHAIARAGAASGESVVSLTTQRPSKAIAANAATIARRVPGAVGVSNSFAPASTNAVMGRRIVHAWGRAEMEERIGSARYRVSAASFFQVNTEMVGRILDLMATGLAQPRRIVDLYCGAGTFAIAFAKHGSTVVGIEENPGAIREANANAELNGVVPNLKFLVGRVEAVLARPEGRDALCEAEIVFLDPPRKGSDEHTLDAIVAADVATIWYLSCNPATLARDCKHLREGGYRLGLVQPFDMFPQTGHVETLAVLHRVDRPVDAEPEVAQLRAIAFSDMPLPIWPTDERYAGDVTYPEFVEK